MAKNPAGRPGLNQTVFNLLSLVLALLEAPGYQTAEKDVVSGRLGLDKAETGHLFALLEALSNEGVLPDPLEFSADGSAVYSTRNSNLSPRLRLTSREADAVAEALEALGVDADSPFSKSLLAAIGPSGSEPAEIAEVPEVVDALSSLAYAVAQERDVTFDYVHVGGTGTPERRHVKPVELHPNSKRLYLKGLDYDREGNERNFLVNNISNVEILAPGRLDAAQAENNKVVLTFSDRTYYNLFEWNDSVLLSKEGEMPVVIETPWFGNDWLARRVRACRGTCTTDSEALDRRVAELRAEPLPETEA
jgi:predicted DNA-binding transcriptional regulator YafY